MIASEINNIIENKALPFPAKKIDLVETHISWVIMTEEYVYKIKKPVTFDFLDYSTLDLRLFYCNEELRLNRRLVKNIYLDVLPVISENESVAIGNGKGEIIDYAVFMKRMDDSLQMDYLLKKQEVKPHNIIALADVLADFHLNAVTIPEGEDWLILFEEFKNIETVIDFVNEEFGSKSGNVLLEAIDMADNVLCHLQKRIALRNSLGFVIDGHGDLHCRNIIMDDPPIVFDCIDFNDDFRKLDILSEIAFLCMDIERFGADFLSHIFTEHYFSKVDCLQNEEDNLLFLYYKMYRANVLLKVHCLRAMDYSKKSKSIKNEIREAGSYYKMFRKYFEELKNKVHKEGFPAMESNH